MGKAVNPAHISFPASDILTEMSEIRERLNLVLDEGTRQLNVMRINCGRLAETLATARRLSPAYERKMAARKKLELLTDREMEAVIAIIEGNPRSR